MYKKLTALLLCGLMLLSAVSCGSSSDSTGGAESTAAGSESETVAETEPEERPDFEKTDYEGATFQILYPGWGQYNNYFFADEQTGDQMNDAIYDRTIQTEEYLNVDITETTPGYIETISPAVKTSVLAGSDDYQLVLTHCIQGLNDMMTSGYLYDWNKLPGINMEKSYWNRTMNDSLTVCGYNFFAVSSYMIADPNAFLFNTRMITDYALENPYDLVRDGKWTIDKATEMAKNVSIDTDGSGTFDANDTYGITAEADWMLNSLMYGCGQFTVTTGADGRYTLDMNNEKMISVVNKCYNLLCGGDYAFTWKYGAADDEMVTIKSDRCLFTIVPLNRSKDLRDSDVDFGILPYPKYDDAQESYITNDWSGLMCLPTTIQNAEMIGNVCEELAYVSTKTTMPAYYTVLLTDKFARDEDSIEMLDIIFGNIVYDPGMNYAGFATGMTNLFYCIPQLIQAKSSDFASFYAKYEKSAQTALDKITDDVEALNLG